MKAPPRCWTSAPGCCRTSSTARSSCTAPAAGWCRSSPRAITCGGCCRWCARALERAATAPRQLAGVAYTAGPGLIGALLTGAALARSLAYAWGVPAIGVHHLEGHLLAPLLESEPPPFPHVALLVSGGHTLLVEVARRRRLPRPRAAPATMPPGEAFDKTAKLLGLPYPGGPQLARARRARPARRVQLSRARCSIARDSSSASRD